MLALEGVGFSAFDLEIEIRCKVCHLPLNSCQTNKSVKFGKAIGNIHRLRSLVWNILCRDRHQFLIRHRRDVLTLQTLCLTLTYLIEERTHRTSIGKIIAT